jgi:DNA ligase-1
MFKPLLAAAVTDPKKIEFPVYVSPKIDGIRCILLDGKVLSRSLKPIPNKHVQSKLANFPENLDGELIIKGKGFSDISSAIMSEEGEPDFTYMVFDKINDEPYHNRTLAGFYSSFMEIVPRAYVETLEALLSREESYLEQGYEGLMIRSVHGKYKYGRSTEKEGILLKLKRFLDSEAEIVGFVQEFANTNPQKVSEVGSKKRSSHKKNKVAKELIGSLICRDIHSGLEIRVSAGLEDELKRKMFTDNGRYLGKLIKYKYMPTTKDKPRHPTFIGFRSTLDIS